MAEPMHRKLGRLLERGLFAARWIMAPVYFAMILMLALLALKFAKELAYDVLTVWDAADTEVIADALTLIDLSLVANLLLMVTLVGYEHFVSRLDRQDDGSRPAWLDQLDFSALKLKLIGSIISIAAIDLLKRFLEVHATPREELVLQTLVFLGFVLAGVLLAFMDWLSAKTHH